jgi:hypothetical protein
MVDALDEVAARFAADQRIPEEERAAIEIEAEAPAPDFEFGEKAAGGSPPPNPPPDDWPRLHPAAIHGLAGEIVKTIGPETEADPASLLPNFLVAFGNAIGRAPHVQVGAAPHYANLFVVVVGDTAKARKGTATAEIRRLFRLAEPDWEGGCVGGGLATGEGVIHAVRDPVTKEEKDADGDFQTVTTDKGVEDKRRLFIQTEFSSTLKVAARDGNILSETIRDAWDGLDLHVTTRNSPLKATAPHISIIGNSTVLDIQKYLSDTDVANGFGNRFLWVLARRSKFLPEGGGLPDEEVRRLSAKLAAACLAARRIAQVVRDAPARERWDAEYRRLGREGRGGMFDSLTARADAQVLRLSMLYALLGGSKEIRLEHLEAALALWAYCEASVRFIFGDAVGDKTADKILSALKAAGAEGLSRSEISEDLFGKHLREPEFDRAIGLLFKAERIRVVESPTAGRPATRYFVR